MSNNNQQIKIVSREDAIGAIKIYLKIAFKYPWLIAAFTGSKLMQVIFSNYVAVAVVAMIIQAYTSGMPESLMDFTPYFLIVVVSHLIGNSFGPLQEYFGGKHLNKCYKDVTNYSLSEITKKDLDFFKSNFTGSLTKKVSTFNSNYGRVTYTLFSMILPSILELIFLLIVLSVLSKSAVLVLSLVVLFVVGVSWNYRTLRKHGQYAANEESKFSKITGHISDIIGNMQLVKSSGNVRKEISEHSKHIKELSDAHRQKFMYRVGNVTTSIEVSYFVIIVFGILFSMHIGIANGYEIAFVFLLFSYYSRCADFIVIFNETYRSLEHLLISSSEFMQIVKNIPRVNDLPGAKELDVSSMKGEIVLENAAFYYKETKNMDDKLSDYDKEEVGIKVFSGLNLKIKAGEKVGVVGRSGAGKSSLIQLLLRFYDVDSGSIKLDNINIKELKLDSLRGSISYVSQDSQTFHRTIGENIAYGIDNATDEDIYKAAKDAHALEFIKDLKDGFDTLVGERGVKLSGGQRQRIAIARAFLKNAPILILDEATSALDSESEEVIQDSLQKLMKNKTTIVIAHRLSTLKQMDRIVVMEKGEIAEQGAHSQLVKKSKIYSSLWNKQVDGFVN